MANSPTLVDKPVIPIEDIPGGGVSEDGRSIIIEFKALSGQQFALQLPHNLADRLNLATAQYGFTASEMRKTGQTNPEAATAGAPMTLQANLIRFQVASDGSSVRLVATGIGGPPLTIDFPGSMFPAVRSEMRKTENMMTRIAKAQKRHRP